MLEKMPVTIGGTVVVMQNLTALDLHIATAQSDIEAVSGTRKSIRSTCWTKPSNCLVFQSMAMSVVQFSVAEAGQR